MAIKKELKSENNNLEEQLQSLVDSEYFREKNNNLSLKKEAFDQSITIKVTKSIKNKLSDISIKESSQISEVIRRAIMSLIKNYKD